MALPGPNAEIRPDFDQETKLFYHRYQRKHEPQLKKILKNQSGPMNDAEGKSERMDFGGNLKRDFGENREKATHRREPGLLSMKRGKMSVPKSTIAAYSRILVGFPSRRKQGNKPKPSISDNTQVSDHRKSPENDSSLSSLSHMANELKVMFAKMPKAPESREESKGEVRKSPGKRILLQNGPAGPSVFPRISAASTPRRQPVPPPDSTRSKSQHRPKLTSRRLKDQVMGFQQFFVQFHQKSRNLLQQLEANVLGK